MWIVLPFLPPASAVEVIESEPSCCVCFCLSVGEHSHSQTVEPTTSIFGMGVDLDYTGIAGQGHRSKVKVKRSENVISRLLPERNSHVKSLWPMT